MKRGLLILAGLFLCAQFMLGATWAQTEGASKLDILGVKKVSLERDSGEYWANMLLVLRNGSDVDVRLRNFDFSVGFELPESSGPRIEEGEGTGDGSQSKVRTCHFGTGRIDDCLLPKAKEGPSLTDLSQRVYIGPDNEETMRRIVEFATIVGDPAGNVKVALKGEGELCRDLDREGGGLICQKGIIIELVLPKGEGSQPLLWGMGNP